MRLLIQWGLVISQAHQIFRGTEYPISNKEFPTDQIFVYLPWILDIPCWLLDIVLRDKKPVAERSVGDEWMRGVGQYPA
jgi:hypothetical protein